MKYRSEIDGLRALAVLPVVLFHAGLPGFEGGFVGVDVFFVISGYLITCIIASALDNGTFSLIEFYERRARRILPALFGVVIVTLPLAWFLMMPSQLKDYCQSLVAVATFSANVFFFLKSGYFEPAVELSPMLHTWSLAVEEQYYLLFPLLLMLTWRFGKRTTLVVLVSVSIASLVFAQVMSSSAPTANFFLATGRAWELMLGALVALWGKHWQLDTRFASMGALLGIGCLAMSLYLIDNTTPFPSLWTLLPVVGAGLVIQFASEQNIAGRLLSNRGLVGVGLISYSTYLWHQPLFAFARLATLGTPQPALLAGLASLSIGLGFLSWRYIEKPFRQKGRFSFKQVMAGSAVGLLMLMLLGAAGHFTKGFGSVKYRLAGPQAEALMGRLGQVQVRRKQVWTEVLADNAQPFSGDAIRTLVIGDSLAEDLYVALTLNKERFHDYQFRRLRLDDVCMARVSTQVRGANDECGREVEEYQTSSLTKEAGIFLIAAGWDRDSPERLEKLLRTLRDRQVVVFGTAAFADMKSLLYQVSARSIPRSAWPKFFAEYRHEPSWSSSQSVFNVVSRYGAKTVNKYELYCEERVSTCELMDENDMPMIVDQRHLTVRGAERFGILIDESGWIKVD